MRDNSRLSLVCGSGNSSSGPYRLKPFHTDDITPYDVTYDVGPYPRSADFQPGGALFVATNGDEIEVFAADAGTRLRATAAPSAVIVDAGSSCGAPSGFTRVRFSTTGRFTVGIYDCQDYAVLTLDDVGNL